jgi:hypothetical protein
MGPSQIAFRQKIKSLLNQEFCLRRLSPKEETVINLILSRLRNNHNRPHFFSNGQAHGFHVTFITRTRKGCITLLDISIKGFEKI